MMAQRLLPAEWDEQEDKSDCIVAEFRKYYKVHHRYSLGCYVANS
jgi:hypothetical protein